VRKLKQINDIDIYHLKVLQHRLEFSVINLYKIVIQEASAVIEDVVVWYDIKSISYLAWTMDFNLIFDAESHVAEWKIYEFFDN
jgi:hypothetical protein